MEQQNLAQIENLTHNFNQMQTFSRDLNNKMIQFESKISKGVPQSTVQRQAVIGDSSNQAQSMDQDEQFKAIQRKILQS